MKNRGNVIVRTLPQNQLLVARKVMKSVTIFVIGVLAGIASVLAFFLLSSNNTEVWKATVDLQSSNGVVIPAGTELVVKDYMPEGFVALTLSVNVEGEELEAFEKTVSNKNNLRIPVWVQKSN